MVSFGRVCFVSVPFVLTVVSIIAMLVASLAGITNKSLYMFEVNTTDLQISVSDLPDIVTRSAPVPLPVPIRARSSLHAAAAAVAAKSMAKREVGYHDKGLLHEGSTSSSSSTSSSGNITGSQVGIADVYDFNLWNYCTVSSEGKRNCTKPGFDWAKKAFNETENEIKSIASGLGANITLNKDITNALDAFATLSKWTQVVFMIAYGFLAGEIVFGLFTSCSRGVSCLTFVVSGVAAIATTAAAGLATATALVVVGVVKSTAKWYGVDGKLNSGYLAAVWIAAAAAIAASFFWAFTICCCKPESRRSGRSGGNNYNDKHMSGSSYQPLHEPNPGFHPAFSPSGQKYPTNARSDLAYEPYSSRT